MEAQQRGEGARSGWERAGSVLEESLLKEETLLSRERACNGLAERPSFL